MKRATIELTKSHLQILGTGGAVTVKLPDAEVVITMHPSARLKFRLDDVFAGLDQVINKGRGRQ